MRLACTGLIAAALLGGCTLSPHNDVLIFGTDTHFGARVTSDPATGGTPSVNLGYQRREAVWMPLAEGLDSQAYLDSLPDDVRTALTGRIARCIDDADATDSAAVNACLDLLRGRLYQGDDSGGDPATSRIDAYSVFASFGARFNGSARNGSHQDVSAGAGLAQYFATGLAAQNLAANENVFRILAIEPATTGELNAVRAHNADLSAEVVALRARGAGLARPILGEIDTIMACAAFDSASPRWQGLTEKVAESAFGGFDREAVAGWSQVQARAGLTARDLLRAGYLAAVASDPDCTPEGDLQ